MKRSWHQNFKRAPKANRTDVDGTVFDSASELRRWTELSILNVTGCISGLERQVPFPLILPDGTPVKTPTGRTMIFTADFRYTENGNVIIEDYKGIWSPDAKLRIAIFEAIYKTKVRITGAASFKKPRKTRKK